MIAVVFGKIDTDGGGVGGGGGSEGEAGGEVFFSHEGDAVKI